MQELRSSLGRRLPRRLAVVTLTASLAIGILFDGRGQSVPKLINYQGKLTDAAGKPFPDGSYGVVFRIWDKQTLAIGQQPIWGAEYNVTMLNGTFNVILGADGGISVTTPANNDIATAFNGSDRFLGLTLTRMADGSVISAANQREILPRQQLLSVPYALSVLNIGTNQIGTVHLADSSVTFPKLAPRAVGTNVAAGGIAISQPNTFEASSSSFVDVPNLTLTLKTDGKPVTVCLAGMPSGSKVYLTFTGVGPETSGSVQVVRNLTNVVERIQVYASATGAGVTAVGYPPSAFRFSDFSPPGTPTSPATTTYRLQAAVGNSVSRIEFQNVRLVAHEW